MRKLTCYCCYKKHANIGCSVESCPRSYHIECGIARNASFEFAENFPSYCARHVRYKQNDKPMYKDFCGICLVRMNKKAKSILIPCCKNSWFHHSCLQTFANTAGVWFKCPLCNDKKVCYQVLPKHGVFLPEKVLFSNLLLQFIIILLSFLGC